MKSYLPLLLFTSLLRAQSAPVNAAQSAPVNAAQSAPGTAAQSSAGVSADWDISKSVAALSTQATRLKPILDQLTPQAWVAKGAPDTYVSQWKGAQDELGYVVNSAKALEKQPERLTLALDTYFRWQSLETRLHSLADGVRKYQNPAVGDLMIGVLAENSANRDNLRQHITDLAITKEQEFQIVDKEAQRCRGTLNRQPAPKKEKQ